MALTNKYVIKEHQYLVTSWIEMTVHNDQYFVRKHNEHQFRSYDCYENVPENQNTDFTYIREWISGTRINNLERGLILSVCTTSTICTKIFFIVPERLKKKKKRKFHKMKYRKSVAINIENLSIVCNAVSLSLEWLVAVLRLFEWLRLMEVRISNILAL